MKRVLILSALSGILLSLAFPPYNLEFLVWIGFIPLFFAIFDKFNPDKRIKIFLPGFIAGLIYFLIVMKWLWTAYPLTWAGLDSKFIGFILISLIWLISAAGMGLWWSLSTGFSKKVRGEWLLFFLPAIFVVSEFIRSWFFGFIWAGPGTLWGPHWTIGNLSYALHNNQFFLKLSSFIGIYGITFTIIFVNLIILYLIKMTNSWPKKIIAASFVVFFLTSGLSFLLPESKDEIKNSISIAVIQTKTSGQEIYSAEKELNDFKKQIDLLKEASKATPQPKIIVFPEGTNFFKSLSIFLDAPAIKNFFNETFSNPVLIIDNSRLPDENGNLKSRVLYLNSKEGIINFYDKRLLTPIGEFMPYHLKFIISLFSKDYLSLFSSLRESARGSENSKPIEIENAKIGALVCSGIFSPSLFKDLSKQNANILIAMTSTGIFKGSTDIIQQDLAAAKFRAAENGKPMVVSANYGYSYFISNYGKIEKMTPDKEPRIFTAEVVPKSKTTWYNKTGDFPILILSFITILTLIIITKRD